VAGRRFEHDPGGAELTQAEFRAAAPDSVEIVDCPREGVDPSCDLYVVQNCVGYSVDDLRHLEGKPVVKYWHDVGPHLQPGVREWLDERATHVCCSPIQAEYMGLTDAAFIPPPIDLARFEAAAAKMNGDRSGSVCVGSWRNYGKAAHKVAEWGAKNGGVEFFGDGPFAPTGAVPVPYERMPELLAQYERFVFLPMVLEPFGRTVMEAWAAGCIVTTNNLVGAKYWIENDPAAAIETVRDD
jgi:hypothetical protein